MIKKLKIQKIIKKEIHKQNIKKMVEENEYELINMSTKTNEIRYIYHLSDIHIRNNTERQKEYRKVFERTYEELRNKIKKKNSLIVITGDIIHLKTVLSPESVDLTYDFFETLCKIAPVIVITGNHDCNLTNKDRMDALTPIIKKFGNFENVYYLKYSGVYRYNNIIFGVSSLLDGKFIYATEINETMLDDIDNDNKYKIALHHGMLKGTKMDNGFITNNGITKKYFNGYDYVMLGDLHTHQIVNAKKTMAYAGSLIQQTHGEPLRGHGFLEWDLLKGKIELCEIKNDYGFCKIQIKNGKMIKSDIPKNPTIKFILENTNKLEYEKIYNKLKKHYNISGSVPEVIILNNYGDSKGGNTSIIYDDRIKNSIVNKFLEKKQFSDQQKSLILDLHKKIENIVKTENDDNSFDNKQWNILKLKFSNMLSYGPNNVIDFRNYENNKIIGIFAPNHYGKSSILDIILFCIFDKCSRGERRDIMNKNKNDMHCKLSLEIGNEKYIIERRGKRSTSSVEINVKFYKIVYDKNNNKIKESLTGVDKNDTNRIISRLLGNYDDYLATCICIQDQGKHGNFISMTQKQKKEYLYEILRLNIFDKCYTYANEKLKIYKTKLKEKEKEIKSYSNNLASNISELKDELIVLEQKKIKVMDLYELRKLSINLMKTPEIIKYNELIQYDLNTEVEIINTKNDIIDKINNSEISKINKKIEKYQNLITKTKNENNSKILIFEYNTKLEKLYSKIINIPNIYNDFDLNESKKSRDEMQNKINNIGKKLKLLNNKLKNEKINKIKDIRKQIESLEESIEYVDPESESKLVALNKKLKKTKLQLFELSIEYVNNRTISESDKEKLTFELQLKEKFKKHVESTISNLNLCTENNKIQNILDQEYMWLDDYNNWKKNVKKLMKNKPINLELIDNLNDESQKLNNKILNKSIDVLTLYENNRLNKKIQNLKNKLDIANKIKDYKNKNDILMEKLQTITNNINNFMHYLNSIQLNKKIDDLKNKIIVLEENHLKIKSDIKNFKEKVEKYKNQLNNEKKYTTHLKLIELHELNFFVNELQKKKYDTLMNDKNELEFELNNINNKITEIKFKLKTERNTKKQYTKLEKQYNKMNQKHNLCETYSNIMNFNGIPYEILKSILPQIESKINETLHNMVNFNIEFLFYDESQNAKNKQKIIKTNMDKININICHPNASPCNIELASGSEKFIIGIAIRMVLYDISETVKPNFFIIDEGWGCLDDNYRSNIENVMNYIKNQYEHVLIISHIEELKNQADYNIEINKPDHFSHVDNRIKKLNSNKVVRV